MKHTYGSGYVSAGDTLDGRVEVVERVVVQPLPVKQPSFNLTESVNTTAFSEGHHENKNARASARGSRRPRFARSSPQCNIGRSQLVDVRQC